MKKIYCVKEIESQAASRPINEIVLHLQETIGQKLTTYLVGLTNSNSYSDKARCAYTVVQVLENTFDQIIAKTWLLGTNTKLNNQSPAFAIQHAKDLSEYKIIVQAACAFAEVFY